MVRRGGRGWEKGGVVGKREAGLGKGDIFRVSSQASHLLTSVLRVQVAKLQVEEVDRRLACLTHLQQYSNLSPEEDVVRKR
jgi:hypothetical protein